MHQINSDKKPAVIISTILITLTLICTFFLLMPQDNSENYIVDVYQNGKLIQSVSLEEVVETQIFTIKGANGCRNEIQITADGVAIISADCPDKLCVKQGIITNSKLPITCLPNHLVVQLRSSEGNTDSITDDIISY